MKTVKRIDPNKTDPNHESAVDIATIRERVRRIKATWSPQVARDRAEEGKRRRAELERMLRDATELDCTLVV